MELTGKLERESRLPNASRTEHQTRRHLRGPRRPAEHLLQNGLTFGVEADDLVARRQQHRRRQAEIWSPRTLCRRAKALRHRFGYLHWPGEMPPRGGRNPPPHRDTPGFLLPPPSPPARPLPPPPPRPPAAPSGPT